MNTRYYDFSMKRLHTLMSLRSKPSLYHRVKNAISLVADYSVPKSSNILKIRHVTKDLYVVDGKPRWKSSLYVTFYRDNRVYRYEGVPFRVFKEFTKADSPGKFFNENVRNTYPYTEVTPPLTKGNKDYGR